MTLSRRNFLKGSIVVAAGALGSFALSGCSSPAGGAEMSAAGSSGMDAAPAPMQTKVTLHRGYAAAHGESCYTQVVVAVDESGVIVAANVDEYQFMGTDVAGIVPVPNSDSDFSKGIVEGSQLMSKVENNKVYSDMIAAKAGATQTWVDSMTAIQAYAAGKKPSELKSVSIDVVSGATLKDTPNYLAAIAEVALDEGIVTEGSFDPQAGKVALGRVNAVCHGAQAFGSAVSLVQGDVIVASSIDEFQFVGVGDDVVSVPNSDKKFGLENYAEGKTLTSKSANSKSYSALMAEKAGATVPWLSSMTAIEAAVAGQKISDVAGMIDGPDAVSGATLVDTATYAAAAVDAARKA